MRPTRTANWVKKYESGMANAGPAYIEGIDSVTEAPTAKAAQNLDKAQRNYADSINSGRMANALNAVTNEQWKTAAKKKGASRLATGAVEARAKVQAHVAAVGSQYDALRAQIAAMPRATAADMEARQLAWSRGMRAMAGKS